MQLQAMIIRMRGIFWASLNNIKVNMAEPLCPQKQKLTQKYCLITDVTHNLMVYAAFLYVFVDNSFICSMATFRACLLYTSDAADDLLCVDLGGRRIIKK